MPVLTIDNLHVDYRTRSGPLHAVRGASLSIEQGEVLGLVGESGSGKSTLAYSIVRYLGGNGRIVGGRILFQGRDILTMSERDLTDLRGSEISMVYQDPHTSLNPALTVGEQVAEVVMIHKGMDHRAAMAETERLFTLVNLSGPRFMLGKYPHELSGGEKQRVLIASAFSCNPKLLILDEPTTALDATTAAEVLELLADLQRRFQTAVLYITHDLGLVARVAQRIQVIYAGQIVETGPTRDVLTDPRHPYTRSLLDSVPRPGTSIHEQRLPTVTGPFPNLRAVPDGCIFQSRCPFVADACRQGRVELRSTSPAREAACVRLEEIPEVKLPVVPAGTRPARSERTVLAAREIRVWHKITDSLAAFTPWRKPKYVRAADGVSLQVQPAETVGIVGESGSGKSTVARAMLGLNQARGEVELSGRTFSPPGSVDRDYRRRVQIVFQHPDSSLNPRKRVRDLVGRPLLLFGLANRRNLDEKIGELLRSVRLPESYADRYPHELSGGEKQRVAIARAFASQPDVIICDELTSGLDVSTQATIVNLLADLQERLGTSYVFIAHDLNLVRYVADRISVMYMGNVVESGLAEQVFEPPYHPYTEALISAALIPDLDVQVRHVRLEGPAPNPLDLPAGCRFHTRCPHKAGEICTLKVPALMGQQGHHPIACHIPIETLTQLPPVWHGAALKKEKDA